MVTGMDWSAPELPKIDISISAIRFPVAKTGFPHICLVPVNIAIPKTIIARAGFPAPTKMLLASVGKDRHRASSTIQVNGCRCSVA